MRISENHQEEVAQLYQSALKARHIQTIMRERDSQLEIPKRKLWNLKQKHAIMKLDGRTPMDTLYTTFKESGFETDVQRDIDKNITHLVFVHLKNMELGQDAISLAPRCWKYDSLFHGLGSFFVYIKNEDNNSYIIAINFIRILLQDNHPPKVFVIYRELALMEALQITFPSASILLCIDNEEWKAFSDGWRTVAYSNTI
uniref:AlNc14C177G8150 protein n=1 Tax=Albugo laibachii Nc14 TaxID=890382 RepID=F0WNZ7_9STRA|nr:AlNc14C177G8150 [Albugo laibachii Nc14]|eukprot:CCA23040.1 AlNc14C177G8150 [Albugo laibachii Nc14]